MRNRPLIAFYGDDFTGSTDALEALALNGIPTILFLEPPSSEDLARFGFSSAIGIAGESRSRSPEWMSENLPGIFRQLKEMGAQLCQYKICSTFDSSPQTGSIGCALEIGAEVFGSKFVPVMPAAPRLERYVVFGHLFANANGRVYRIDRHPSMSVHPVTPMKESDLQIHLGRQTRKKIQLLDILMLESPEANLHLENLLKEQVDIILFDGIREDSVERSVNLIWEMRDRAPFVVGSSGFTYGLGNYLRSRHVLEPVSVTWDVRAAERIIVLAGSCSPVTEQQIRWALAHGFSGIRLTPGGNFQDVIGASLKELQSGKSVVLYSALGPSDCERENFGASFAAEMGVLLGELLLRSGVKRVVIAGGDTASHTVRQLGITALTFRAPLDPGAPICEVHAEDTKLQGLELILKGGQIGREEFFGSALLGRNLTEKK
jgi:uncharacterized protein YgbK (DUF1537 family)